MVTASPPPPLSHKSRIAYKLFQTKAVVIDVRSKCLTFSVGLKI